MQRASAEEWRGIVPLHSTREDVARVFGECANADKFCEFALPNEEIFIELSTTEFCPNIPINTVLMIERILQNETTLAALGLDKRRFKSFNPAIPPISGYRAYIDEKEGLILKSFRGQIFGINHIPNNKERQVCRGYYRKPKELARVISEHVPFVRIECPQPNPIGGEKVVITASYGHTGGWNRLTWATTGGRIMEGQHTKKIVLDTTGLDGRSITVTVEREDGFQHISADSCVLKVSAAVKE